MNHATVKSEKLHALENATNAAAELLRAYDRLSVDQRNRVPGPVREEIVNVRHKLADLQAVA